MTENDYPDRPLSLNEHAVLLWVLAATPDRAVAESLYLQSTTALVTGGPPTMLELTVSPAALPVATPDGPLPVRATICDHDGNLLGELLVWIVSGYLSAIEYSWYTDAVPADLPAPSNLRLE